MSRKVNTVNRIIGNHRARRNIFRFAMLLGVFERAWRVRAQVHNEAKRNKRGGRGKKLSTTRVTRHNALAQVPRRNFSWGWESAGVVLFFSFFRANVRWVIRRREGWSFEGEYLRVSSIFFFFFLYRLHKRNTYVKGRRRERFVRP